MDIIISSINIPINNTQYNENRDVAFFRGCFFDFSEEKNFIRNDKNRQIIIYYRVEGDISSGHYD